MGACLGWMCVRLQIGCQDDPENCDHICMFILLPLSFTPEKEVTRENPHIYNGIGGKIHCRADLHRDSCSSFRCGDRVKCGPHNRLFLVTYAPSVEYSHRLTPTRSAHLSCRPAAPARRYVRVQDIRNHSYVVHTCLSVVVGGERAGFRFQVCA